MSESFRKFRKQKSDFFPAKPKPGYFPAKPKPDHFKPNSVNLSEAANNLSNVAMETSRPSHRPSKPSKPNKAPKPVASSKPASNGKPPAHAPAHGVRGTKPVKAAGFKGARTFTDKKGNVRKTKSWAEFQKSKSSDAKDAVGGKHPNAKTYTQRKMVYDKKFDENPNTKDKKQPNAVAETLHKIGGPAVGKTKVVAKKDVKPNIRDRWKTKSTKGK